MSCSIHDDEGSYGSMQVCNGICIYKACNTNLPHCLVLARAMFPYSCCFHAAILYMAIEISDGALHKLCDSLCTCAAEQWREVCTCEHYPVPQATVQHVHVVLHFHQVRPATVPHVQ